MSTTANLVNATEFAIGFDERDRARLHELWDGIIDSGHWTEGELTGRLESTWAEHDGMGAVASCSWSGGALAALEFCGVPARRSSAPPTPSWRRPSPC